jgi:hypothetical protein
MVSSFLLLFSIKEADCGFDDDIFGANNSFFSVVIKGSNNVNEFKLLSSISILSLLSIFSFSSILLLIDIELFSV